MFSRPAGVWPEIKVKCSLQYGMIFRMANDKRSVNQGKKQRNAAKKENRVSEEVKPQKKEYAWQKGDSAQQGLLVIFLFAVAALSLLSFVDAAGQVGVWLDRMLGWLFGWGRYAMPVVFAALGYIFLHPERYAIRVVNTIGLLLFLLSGLGLLFVVVQSSTLVDAAKAGDGGGFGGLILAYPLRRFTGIWATIVILVALFAGSWLLMFNWSLHVLLERLAVFGFFAPAVKWFRQRLIARKHGYTLHTGDGGDEDVVDEELEGEEDAIEEEPIEEVDDESEENPFQKKDVPEGMALKSSGPAEQLTFIPKEKPRVLLPRIDMPLNLLTDRNEKPSSGDIEDNKMRIQKALESFGIDVEMGEVSVGPMVTQYTLKPSEGVKLTQITTLHNDLSLALAAHPIRIEAPIPGKSLVGIEVPNKAIATVTLKEILSSKSFKQRQNNLSIALGKDVAGKAYVQSVQKMPHVLIAGATGSGKSVCINGIIVSLVYQNSPDDLKLIMVDPKRVELSVYNGIPHLLTPVITDVEKTINALKWTVAEMDRRYELLSRVGKRNIESYNSSVEDVERLPYIVFIIDELADLMTVAANSVEAAIVRLAQMSRAVGIHLVLATQRPSVDVITGLIKANMPARIAFSVTSLVDSRTILDFSGAEKLLGRGDMLYIDSQLSRPKRVQGAFLDDGEIERVVAFLRTYGDPHYNTEVTEKGKSAAAGSSGSGEYGDDASDELLSEAKKVIIDAGKASASLLQRRLRVGYARAARILDILEEQGVIGPADGAKPREILITEEEIGDAPDEEVEDDGATADEDDPRNQKEERDDEKA